MHKPDHSTRYSYFHSTISYYSTSFVSCIGNNDGAFSIDGSNSNDAESFNGSDGSSFRSNGSSDSDIANGSGTYANKNTNENTNV
mmetsp:Transcript_49113/g.54909  ORF Transcript_49113/g.54909 Transcript_49113/m.54909 type:complete len:85 (+) Transcript_49113:2-256(+)